MKTFALFFALLAATVFGTEVRDVVRPGMSFTDASALLEKHRAKPTMIQIAYPDERKNRRLAHFILADDRTIELSLTRRKQGAEWTIKALSEVVWVQPEQNREKEWRELPELVLQAPANPASGQKSS